MVYVPFDKQVAKETGEDVTGGVHAGSGGIVVGHRVPGMGVPIVREHPRLTGITVGQHHLEGFVCRSPASSSTTSALQWASAVCDR